jgi:AhpD family alkylhydroperoxidase
MQPLVFFLCFKINVGDRSGTFDSSFTAKEREAINLIVSQVNECDYCLAAHTSLAKMRGFTEEQTIDIRKGNSDDAQLDVLLN